MEDTDKKHAVVYSLNHKSLVASGVSNYMEVLDAYSDKDVNHLELSEELISSNIIEPVMLVDITKEGRITEEQMEHIGQLSGKAAIRERREDFEYLKPLLDKPFWKAEQGMVISTDENTEVILNSGNKIFPSTDFIIDSNKQAEESTYVHSFNINSLQEAFKEAREILNNESNDSIGELFENSDRESRMVMMGCIINDTLGLSKNTNPKVEDVVEMFNSFRTMQEYKDYMGAFGMAASQNDDVKKAFQATRKIEKYAFDSEDMQEKHQDYVKNIFKRDIGNILREMRSSVEDKIIKTLENKNENSSEEPPIKPEKKTKKKNQLTLDV
jgi:hypothetical protein